MCLLILSARGKELGDESADPLLTVRSSVGFLWELGAQKILDVGVGWPLLLLSKLHLWEKMTNENVTNFTLS